MAGDNETMDLMGHHLLMLSLWWGWDEDDGAGVKLMTFAPLRKDRVVHAILRDDGEGPLRYELYPTAQAAREAWASHPRRTP